MSYSPTKSSSKQKLVSNTTCNSSSHNPSGPGKTSEVHVVQSTTVDKSLKGKKNGKGKGKVDAPKQGPPKSSASDSSQWKTEYL